ncbi:hypothetical protein BJY04DRAFT_188145 [Aspergillus karnatakaensis]|uniref:uncharacterized protein n=1 Tax=Aspergillus karnatakaensis TaxID=1810916 RepID=UPI003CCE22CE
MSLRMCMPGVSTKCGSASSPAWVSVLVGSDQSSAGLLIMVTWVRFLYGASGGRVARGRALKRSLAMMMESY